MGQGTAFPGPFRRKESNMNTEEVKKKFKSTTKDGSGVNILTYISGQEYPIIAVIRRKDQKEWETRVYSEHGKSYVGIVDDLDLVLNEKAFLPKDVLCRVWNNTKNSYEALRYSDGNGHFFVNAGDSFSSTASLKWDNYKIVKNPMRRWSGKGECPIPDGCLFRVFFNGRWTKPTTSNTYIWEHEGNSRSNITASQILGE